MLDQDAPLHGLGIQGHMGANFTPPEKVIEILEDFASFGLDISITEYDAAGADETIAGDYMRDLLIAAFSVPQVRNFLMWGFWDGSHWHHDAPMFRQDWSLKPAGEAFIDWIYHTWWTNAIGRTTRDGHFTTRAFYGQYEITAEFDGKQANVTTQFDKDSETIILKIDTALSSVNSQQNSPSAFQLCDNYPNPFNPATTITFALPHLAHVKIDIYNSCGRHITTLAEGSFQAGEHSLTFNAANQPSGIYWLRMTAEGFAAQQKMLLLR